MERAFFRSAGSVVGSQLVSPEEVVEQIMRTKLQTIMDQTSHPRLELVRNLQSSPTAPRSFLPSASA